MIPMLALTIRGTLIFVLSGLLVGCLNEEEKGEVAAGVPFRISNPERGFTVVFPGRPKEASTMAKSTFGLLRRWSYTKKIHTDVGLVLSVVEYPVKTPLSEMFKVLDGAVDNEARAQKGTVTFEGNTVVSRLPAKVFEMDCGSYSYRGRFIQAGRRMYSISAFVPKELVELPREVGAFFESLEISESRFAGDVDSRLIGRWKLSNSKIQSEGMVVGWEFEESEIVIWNLLSEVVVSRSQYVVDMTKEPKWITSILPYSRIEQRYRRGIYRIKDGELHILNDLEDKGGRPTGFSEDGHMIFVRVRESSEKVGAVDSKQ